MEIYLKNCRIYSDGALSVADIYIDGGSFSTVESFSKDIPILAGENMVIAPAFCDLHVHLRQPGFPHKETMVTGTHAAVAGGFSTVCAMPNLIPVPHDLTSLQHQLDYIKNYAVVEVLPYASITIDQQGKELSQIEAMAPYCCGYSDDGNGVQDRDMMKQAMLAIAATDKILAAHVEDNSYLLPNGTVHSGIAAKRYGLVGMPSETEYLQLERDMELVRETNCRYHLC
ncbi:MAG: amidohydrolase family protein, partial [Oscillospiraceae bacterium]|nr:amidohydrolase family protein [Oscillospiraceae bacterium]